MIKKNKSCSSPNIFGQSKQNWSSKGKKLRRKGLPSHVTLHSHPEGISPEKSQKKMSTSIYDQFLEYKT
jgi:hypothetical protein